MPPMTTVASGRCTSAPVPVFSAIGRKPSARHQGDHQNRPQPQQRTFDDGLVDILALREAIAETPRPS
jgi:hypothetical protein